MKTLSITDVKPGMIAAADVSIQGTVLVSKDEEFTIENISNLIILDVSDVQVVSDEVPKVKLTNYQRFRKDNSFKKFQSFYELSLSRFKENMLFFLSTGQKIEDNVLYKMYIDISSILPNSYSLFNYLYYMVPNEDELTFTHSLSSALVAGVIADWMGFSLQDKRTLVLCGFYFDIGKLRLPYDILWKTGRLTYEEINIIKTHPVLGFSMVQKLDLNNRIKNSVLMHHERIDGTGYPYGLQGIGGIDEYARYMAIIDSYVALASPRAYRDAYSPLQIISILESSTNKYDPKLLEPILHKIAQSQIGQQVKLSDGSVWEVSSIIKENLSRPLLYNDAGEMLNLAVRPDLKIAKII